jgi:predicted phage-related endonuclease
MRFLVIDVPQRSDDWFAARLGKVTGSRAADMMATRKDGKPSASRTNLRVQLALERITGKPCERDYQSRDMQYGSDTEQEARVVYSEATGQTLKRVGFLSHLDLMAGVSLDGYVGDYEGIVEMKCPIPATHLDYIRTGKVPQDYLWQVIHGLWITGAAWCDWMSYAKEFPRHLRTKIVRVRREDVDLAAYELAVRLFLNEVEKEVAFVSSLEVA